MEQQNALSSAAVADGINVHRVVIKDPRYADDVHLLAEQEMALQCLVDELQAVVGIRPD